jgi:hypothetical protein
MLRKLAALITTVSLLAGCELAKVPVSVERTVSGVIIHCESLGEYPSDIGTIELRDELTQQIVWRVRPEKEMFQLHNFSLAVGPNRSIIPVTWGGVRAVVPVSGPFTLHRGRRYQVRVCAPSGLKRCGLV